MGSFVSSTLRHAASLAWEAFQSVNTRIPDSPCPIPIGLPVHYQEL